MLDDPGDEDDEEEEEASGDEYKEEATVMNRRGSKTVGCLDFYPLFHI